MSVRLAAGLEYDGSGFCGWQAQQDAQGVQTCVEAAFSAVADEAVSVFCAGRTDAGVHALGQVIHLDTTAQREPRNWLLGANSNLPSSVRVHWVKVVDEHFNARFSATGRSYRYLILNTATPSALLRDRSCWRHRPLDAAAMNAAAQLLLGEHDFSAFRAAACQAKSPVRELRELRVERRGDRIIIGASANAFLHHMVRNLVGALIRVGEGEAEPAWVREVLDGRDRSAAGITAPASGLYLTSVSYPDAVGIPAGASPLGDWP